MTVKKNVAYMKMNHIDILNRSVEKIARPANKQQFFFLGLVFGAAILKKELAKHRWDVNTQKMKKAFMSKNYWADMSNLSSHIKPIKWKEVSNVQYANQLFQYYYYGWKGKEIELYKMQEWSN